MNAYQLHYFPISPGTYLDCIDIAIARVCGMGTAPNENVKWVSGYVPTYLPTRAKLPQVGAR